jgi:D-glucuronyl C5-epimerase C-terminus
MCSGGVLSLNGRPAASPPAATDAIERSIGAVRVRRISALALGLLALGGATTPSALARGAGGELSQAHVRVRAHAAARHGPSVTAALQSLRRAATITPTLYQQYYAAYLSAKHSLAKLTGTRSAELGAVLANIQAIAAAGGFIPSRLPALFLTLERNRQWWSTEPLLAADERVSFPESKLVWEHYPGQGLEIQWLATFGEGNGYYLSGHENSNLRQLVSEIIPLASKRAGGIAWEYMFPFDGGLPPWTSGLSQGTALQVLARAYSRFKEAPDLVAAQQALGIFQTPPPQGVRVITPAGALYAEYTYAPSDRILNGFIQSLVGLYDYTSITQDQLGEQLFEAGDAEARAIVPMYDTGSWSLYDQFGESDLNYHELLAEFLQHLCERTRKGLPAPPAAPAAPTPSPAPPAPVPATPGSTTATGGASASRVRASATQTVTQVAGDQIYCSTAQNFGGDLHTPPVIALLSKTLRGGSRAGVKVSLSKISTVGLTVRQGARVVWSNRATVDGGKPKLLWITPAKGGTFSVTLTATDLVGNFATATGTILVSAH